MRRDSWNFGGTGTLVRSLTYDTASLNSAEIAVVVDFLTLQRVRNRRRGSVLISWFMTQRGLGFVLTNPKLKKVKN